MYTKFDLKKNNKQHDHHLSPRGEISCDELELDSDLKGLSVSLTAGAPAAAAAAALGPSMVSDEYEQTTELIPRNQPSLFSISTFA